MKSKSECLLPLISVVIPTYNRAHLLKRALQSVFDQRYSKWEVIVIDNSSVDNTDDIVNSFRDNRVRLFKINNHGVVAASRNKGIRVANGNWIAFLDSDDWWMPEKLSECVKRINDDVDFIYHPLRIFESKRFWLYKKTRTKYLKNPVLVNLLVDGNLIQNSSVVVRHSLLEKVNGIDESRDIIAAEDYNAWLKIANNTDKFIFINKALGYYSNHPGGLSNKNMKYHEWSVIRPFINKLKQSDKDKLYSRIQYQDARYQFVKCNYHKVINILNSELYGSNKYNKIKCIYMKTISLLRTFHKLK